ncbi:uncharacterized protein LOC116105959 [Pistacia vera]|uniref:uncharacterized protein LOC116105959 n=1 Tax=Pistacia vera TaxID=55513 RepID=UPI00126387EC|nr:uncharacterized protein LOC116105959 [Pistacia vera]
MPRQMLRCLTRCRKPETSRRFHASPEAVASHQTNCDRCFHASPDAARTRLASPIAATPCLASVRFDVLIVIEAPPQSDLVVELIKKLKPRVVLGDCCISSSLSRFERCCFLQCV